ncbi:MAG TPA: sugar ABC transporter permease, partial [Diaminobutyricibacter sp.]
MADTSTTPAAGGLTEPPGAGRPEPRSGRARKSLRVRVFGRNPLGWLFSAPYLIFIFVVFAYPLVFAVYMSFFDYFFAAPGAVVDRPFVGFANYVQVFTDPAMLQSFANVGIFLIINVPLTVVLSLVLASGLNSIKRFRSFLRVSYYVPYVTASVAIIGVWLFL